MYNNNLLKCAFFGFLTLFVFNAFSYGIFMSVILFLIFTLYFYFLDLLFSIFNKGVNYIYANFVKKRINSIKKAKESI